MLAFFEAFLNRFIYYIKMFLRPDPHCITRIFGASAGRAIDNQSLVRSILQTQPMYSIVQRIYNSARAQYGHHKEPSPPQTWSAYGMQLCFLLVVSFLIFVPNREAEPTTRMRRLLSRREQTPQLFFLFIYLLITLRLCGERSESDNSQLLNELRQVLIHKPSDSHDHRNHFGMRDLTKFSVISLVPGVSPNSDLLVFRLADEFYLI